MCCSEGGTLGARRRALRSTGCAVLAVYASSVLCLIPTYLTIVIAPIGAQGAPQGHSQGGAWGHSQGGTSEPVTVAASDIDTTSHLAMIGASTAGFPLAGAWADVGKADADLAEVASTIALNPRYFMSNYSETGPTAGLVAVKGRNKSDSRDYARIVARAAEAIVSREQPLADYSRMQPPADSAPESDSLLTTSPVSSPDLWTERARLGSAGFDKALPRDRKRGSKQPETQSETEEISESRPSVEDFNSSDVTPTSTENRGFELRAAVDTSSGQVATELFYSALDGYRTD